MFIESVRNRNSPPCILLRESFRDAGKVRHRTLANLSKWPKPVVEGLRTLLKGRRDPGVPVCAPGQPFKITRSLPHGHVAAVLSTMHKLGLPRLLGSKACPERDLCMAMIAARILFPGSKLAASRALGAQTLNSTLARECGIGEDPHENDLYAAMDWLLPRQNRIDEELRGIEGLDWITALRSSQIAALARNGLIEHSLFDEKNLAEPSSAGAERDGLPQAARRAHPPGGRMWQIQSPDFPGERLVVCRNPLLAFSRARKREELLQATEKNLIKIRDAVSRGKAPLRGRAKIGLRAGRIINKHKMAKHFSLSITDTHFSFARREEKIAAEAAIDGIYVVRTSSREESLESAAIVERYKSLSLVENAFRSIKTVDLKVRPIHHRNADRVHSHVFLCMLAYYVEWHMRSVLKPVLFDDEELPISRPDPVVPKEPSPSAKAKARTKRTPDARPVHSFQSLLADLATITRNTIVPAVPGAPGWDQNTEPTPLQKKILDLLDSLPNP